MDVFDLTAKLKLDKGNYESELKNASASSADFGSAAAAAFGVAAAAAAAIVTAVTAAASAFAGAVEDVTAYGDSVDKMSQKVGMSSTSYQKWDYAMQLAGTSMSQCSTGIKTLVNKIADAKDGSEEATTDFNKLGISISDLGSMSEEEIFEAVIKGLQNMTNETDRAATANDLLGRAGQNLQPMFNMTNEELNKVMQNAEKYGLVMSEDDVKAAATFNDSQTTLQKTIEGLRNNIVSKFLPALSEMADGLTDIFSGVDVSGGQAKFKKGLQNFVKVAKDVLPDLIQAGAELMVALADGFADSIETITPAVGELIEAITEVLIANADKLADAAIQVGKAVIAALLVAIGAALKEKRNELLENFMGLGEDMGSGMSKSISDSMDSQPVLSAALGVIQVLEDANLVGKIGKYAGEIAAEWIGEMAEGFGNNTWVQNAVSTLTTANNTLKSKVNTMASNVVKALTPIATNAKTVFNNTASAVKTFASNLQGQISTIRNRASNIIQAFSGVPTQIGTYLSNALSRVTSFASSVQSVTGNIKTYAQNIGNAFSNIGSTISGHLSTGVTAVTNFASSVGGKISTIKNHATNIGSAFSNIGSTISGYLSAGVTAVSSFVGSVSSQVSSVKLQAGNIGSAFSNVGSTISNYLNTGISAITSFVTSVSNQVSSVKTQAGNIGSAFSGIGTQISGYIKQAITAIQSLPTSLSGILSSISQSVSNIVSYFASLPSQLASIGSQAIQNFFNSFENGLNRIINRIKSFINDVEGLLNIRISVNTSSSASSVSSVSSAGTASVASSRPTSSSTGTTYNQTIYVNREVSTADELARAIRTESRYGLMRGTAIG